MTADQEAYDQGAVDQGASDQDAADQGAVDHGAYDQGAVDKGAVDRCPGGQTVSVRATVNGRAVELELEVRVSLADALRDELGLTGTHLGCEHGVCGACTVLVDGEPARSCLMLAAQADASEITTVEGLATGNGSTTQPPAMHPVQQAMYEAISFQCAFCSPGFIMSTVALLADNPNPTEDEIRAELSGNICRCTGYQSIIDGVLTAVEISKGGAHRG